MSEWGRLVVTWTGWDGSVWTLSDPSQNVFLSRGDLRGLSFPPFNRFTSTSPLIAGSRYRGGRTDERDVFWPIVVSADSSDEFLAVNRAFRRTLDPEKLGTWTVTTPGGESRSVKLRHVPEDVGYDVDPVKFGRQVYGVRMVAEQPFWAGAPIKRSWYETAPPPGLYAGPGVLNFAPGSSFDTASIPNPGDVEVYPVWTVKGPSTNIVLGVDGKLIELPTTLGQFDYRVIDTRPDQLIVRDGEPIPGVYGPNEMTYELGAVEFGAIPPGADVPLTVQVTGGSSAGSRTNVWLQITPLDYEAI